jgi:hypothetical protein
MQQVRYIKAAGPMAEYRGMEFVPGLTTRNMKDSGRITKNMDRACTLGRTDECMKVTTAMIKNTDMAPIPGPMEGSTSENGRTTNVTEREPTS